jgi:MFS family permease
VDQRRSSPASARRAVASATALLTACVMPSFVTATAVDLIRQDFAMREGALGLIFGGFYGAVAVGSAPAGWLVDRLGAQASARLAGAVTVAMSLAIALFARSAFVLGLFLVLAGVAVAILEPALNTLLSRCVPRERQALAFAVKQASLPAGLLVTGLAVPLLGRAVGWRVIFVIAAVLALVAAATLPGERRSGSQRTSAGPSPPLEATPLVLLAVASGFGTAAIAALNAFLVVAAPDLGMSPEAAAVVLAAGSALTIALRLVVGLRADRRVGGHLRTIAAMLATGALGFALLIPGVTLPSVVGALLVITFVWGWMGLLSFALVRYYPEAPGRVTGWVQTGLFSGTLLGPIVFGQIVERGPFRVGWVVAGTWSCLAAIIFMRAARALQRTGRTRSIAR